jgi:hypothetical protein
MLHLALILLSVLIAELFELVYLCYIWHLFYLVYLLQSNFNPNDIPFRTMRTMSERVIAKILPDEQIKKVDLHEGS